MEAARAAPQPEGADRNRLPEDVGCGLFGVPVNERE